MSDFIVGLTGGIGSGKTTIANIFAQHGITIVDADIVARNVVDIDSPALAHISSHFGADFIQADGQLDRALLRKRIFSNDADKLWLNNLLHPLIREQLIAQMKAAQGAYCLLVAPLLIENNLTTLVNRVLVIDVSETTQISRTTTRDNNSVEQVQAIIASQASRQVKQDHADDLLNNDSTSLEELKSAVAKLHQHYLTMAAKCL
ncbi:dephospho-CoA kinase [Candidatus Colwellia aromaticivorans]|uniref:dephospho-CoA kinase n=1 Tax=Candidatus Colwellia aromaticivorans TaxID=2267621 RepID=UPI000DF490EF|nr:dephospho-CoA kinase [Candidatus Colwellia aromaticivorans]